MTVEPKASATTLLETTEALQEPNYVSLRLPAGWLDEDASKVLRRLQGFEHATYLVGGCVRDLLVGRYPKDFDVATQAHPGEVKRAFSNCRLIGRRFRLAHILFRNNIIEVATFRKDPNQGLDDDLADGESAADTEKGEDLLIRSDNVFGNPADDAFRRDFTINALYYDTENHRVIDYVGGFEDIEQRVVRTIGDPSRRFKEDPIRMLRAIKFSSRLGFDIEENTWRAMKKLASELRKAAVPRIQEELFRMLRGGYTERSLQLMADSGILRHILPDHHRQLRWELDGGLLWVPPPEEPDLNNVTAGESDAENTPAELASKTSADTFVSEEGSAPQTGTETPSAEVEKDAAKEPIAPKAVATIEPPSPEEVAAIKPISPEEATADEPPSSEEATADEAAGDEPLQSANSSEQSEVEEEQPDSETSTQGNLDSPDAESLPIEAKPKEDIKPLYFEHKRSSTPVRAPIPRDYIQIEEPEHSLFLPRLSPQQALLPLPSMRAMLFAFDMIGGHIPNHIYLGLLSLYPAAQKFKYDPDKRAADIMLQACIEWLEDVGSEFRLARRDRELARLSLMGFLRIHFRKDQRRATSGLARKSYFLDTTALCGIYALALGQDEELYYRLLSRCEYASSLAPVTEAIECRFGPQPKGSGASGQRRGRSRRKRRRPSGNR